MEMFNATYLLKARKKLNFHLLNLIKNKSV